MVPRCKAMQENEITTEIKEIITSARGAKHLVDNSNHRYAHYAQFCLAFCEKKSLICLRSNQ